MKRLFALLLLLCFFALPVSAEEKQIEIDTPQELLAIADDPYGSYILTADIDMVGISWPCPAFYGTLDGNGHAILNLTVTQPGAGTITARDGNYKAYEAQAAGLFSHTSGATVKNLTLLGMQADITTDQPCFLGGIAGTAFDITVENCSVEGTLELRAHNGMFGVAGLVGYGGGEAKDCQVEVTLICTDTGKDTLDEQFLGGILGNGFMDIKSCDIQLDAYISEYGYVHSGGIVGMYYQKPFDPEASHHGRVIYNTVDGSITFFERNDDRRAYCKAVIGEPVADRYGEDHNTTDNFRRDERKEYEQELRPHSCDAPAFAQAVTAPGCNSFGYTTHTCACGYGYVDGYTLKTHSYGDWQVLSQPTEAAPGKSQAVCTLCGEKATREDPYIPPVTTAEPTTTQSATQPGATQTDAPVSAPKAQKTDGFFVAYVAILAVAILALGYFAYREYRYRRYLKRKAQRRAKRKSQA